MFSCDVLGGRSRFSIPRWRIENRDLTPLLAQVAEEPAAAAVARVLELHQQPVGIGEVQLRRAAWRAAAILHAHRDVVPQRAGGCRRVVARLQAVTLER